MHMLPRWLFGLILLVIAGPVRAQSLPFSWEQATIYQVVIDRFSNGNSTNDGSYGRGLDGEGAPYTRDVNGHFMGGDFAGLTGWIENGYFSGLGVNALLLSAPFEQVHGWIGGGDGTIQEYGFHGQWAQDFTQPDAAFGTSEEFRQLVETAHENGIRVLLEVYLDGPGPATLHDMTAFDFGHISTPTWRSWRPAGGSDWSTFESHFFSLSAGPNAADHEEAWARWWGPDWIHANLPGYAPCPDEQPCLGSFSATFRESAGVSSIPDFLQLKWGAEKTSAESAELDAFFARTSYPRSSRSHVIKWLTDWIRDYGVDGFVIRNEAAISEDVRSRLEQEALRAYEDWHGNRSGAAVEKPGFLLVSDGLLKHEPDLMNSDSLEAVFGRRTDAASGLRSILRLSGSDIGLWGDRDHEVAGTRLFLVPGPILIYYGDESGRAPGSSSDPELAAMSPMDWSAAEPESLEHWKKLAAFRADHPSVARGENNVLLEDPYAFYRGVQEGNAIDQVVIAVGVEGRLRLNVAPVWPDDTVLRDAYTGKIAIVSFGQVAFEAAPEGVVLIEEVEE